MKKAIIINKIEKGSDVADDIILNEVIWMILCWSNL